MLRQEAMTNVGPKKEWELGSGIRRERKRKRKRENEGKHRLIARAKCTG